MPVQRSPPPSDALSSSHTPLTPHAQETTLSTFSPREVQSRVRAGASAEEVAADTGWPHDRVLRYAEPLLAERAYIAEQAQAVEVRRSGGGASLRDSAGAALGVDPDSGQITWDARRREDGKWVVSARFAERGTARTAEWTYDHAGRNLHPLDDQARALMGVRTTASDLADPISDALDLVSERAEPVDSRPRLVAVPDAGPDLESDAGPEPDDESSIADADSAAGSDERDGQTTIAVAHPSATPSPQEPPAPAPGPAASTDAPVKPAKGKARKRRASVPSWDEILFGATTPEDR